ncbi:MAG: hypothetical protein KDB90_17265 [Planctomycetes bacterium]|nr:hypothetical protein [Planctomycetota bacterium]
MRTPVSQFLFWFLISFSPAPVVGFITYLIVHAQEPSTALESRPQMYSPLVHDYDRDAPENPVQEVVVDETAPEAPQEAEQQQETEFEITRARKPQQEEPKRKKPPGMPDF